MKLVIPWSLNLEPRDHVREAFILKLKHHFRDLVHKASNEGDDAGSSESYDSTHYGQK